MKIDLGRKTILYPMPVLMVGTYDKKDKPDLMAAAWGGIFNDNMVCLCLDRNHKTVANLKEHKAFTVGVADAKHVTECDYVGIVSANDEPDKLDKANLTAVKSTRVDAPVIDELPLTLECQLVSYDDNTEQAVGNIINVIADDSILTGGKVDPAKLKAITYDPVNHTYIQLGEVVGKAFSDGKKLQ
ncbi:MAG: flavin reductase family protein [Spirochaetia bacterium]|nr:flavin reductase family protein [Spirochaetia bacterium]